MGRVSLVCLLTLASLTLAQYEYNRLLPRSGYEWTPESLVNPEELGDHFEGDIELPLPPFARNGLIDKKHHWPNGKVAYTIDDDFSEEEEATIKRAMDEFEQKTDQCITFHERTNEKDYIVFTNRNRGGCRSSIGRRGGKQVINYAKWCFKRYGSVLHEIMHALGFHHEQSRFDRDDYVTINWDNITPNSKRNFKKYSNTVTSGFKESYNYDSVMHYSAHAFSKNGRKTIETKDPDAKIGQRNGLSKVDLNKLLRMYKCMDKSSQDPDTDLEIHVEESLEGT